MWDNYWCTRDRNGIMRKNVCGYTPINLGKIIKEGVLFCYLFGSYAKGKAIPASDVDLLISTNVKGLKFYGLVEEIRTALHKKVDILNLNQLKDNIELTEEILKDGI